MYGKRHGSGVYFYLDGGRYDGEWVDDRIQGRGKSIYANSNVYEGDWVDGRINGFGTLTYADGDKCVLSEGGRRGAARRGEARRGEARRCRVGRGESRRGCACATAGVRVCAADRWSWSSRRCAERPAGEPLGEPAC